MGRRNSCPPRWCSCSVPIALVWPGRVVDRHLCPFGPIRVEMGPHFAASPEYGSGVSSRYYLLSGPWIAVTLIPWCTCMGSTFPLLMGVIERTSEHKAARSFSYLYVANVFGALLGTLVSAFVLIELMGFQGTLHVAATLNGALAAAAFFVSSAGLSSRSAPNSPPPAVDHKIIYGLPRNSALLMLFNTGLVSMGMEVIWIRQFTPYLGNVVYAFAGILGTYLLAP